MSDSETLALYSEGCSSLRQYSSNVMNVRALAIVQGFAVLGAGGYLVQQKSWLFAAFVSLFGLLFTAVLYALQANYWHHFSAFLAYVVEMEALLRSGETKTANGPWSAYDQKRRERHRKIRWSLSAIHGPYLLLLLALSSLLGLSLYSVWR